MTRVITDFSFEPADRGVGSLWGWYVALGMAMIALGVIAFLNMPTATKASVYMMGVLMLIAAAIQIALSFEVRHWSGFVALLLSAVLYGFAGYMAFANPLLAAKVMTLVLAVAWIAAGFMRIWWSSLVRALSGWGWIAVSGIVTVIVGTVFIVGWPENSPWLLGMVLSIDLIFQGATAIGFGFGLKRLTQ